MFAALLLLVLGAALGRAWAARASALERTLAGATLAATALTLIVRLLGGLGLLTPLALLLSLGAATALALSLAPRAASMLRLRWAVLPTLVGASAFVLAVVAAVQLPVWQWDADGYHLPALGRVADASRPKKDST